MSGSQHIPAISIIVPVYKVEPYLERCMESLLGQSFSDIEIILVDDGSPDGCPKMCDGFAAADPRVKVIHKQNAGLGYARNSGLDAAAGEYAAFVDSDDFVTQDMCEKLYDRAVKTGADIVYGGIYYSDADGITEAPENGKERLWSGEEQMRGLLLDFVATAPGRTRDTVMEVSVWRALFRRSIIEDNGIRFVSERQFISEDVIFDIDVLQKCRTVATEASPVYYYCANAGSLTKTFRADRFGKVKELYCEIKRRLAPLYPESEVSLRCGRFLIARARRSAIAAVRQKKSAGRAQVRQWLKDLCEDGELKKVLAEYPIEKLPFRQYAAALLMKLRAYSLLELLLSLKQGR